MVTNDENILNIYLKEINRIPLLSHEEEVELAKKAASGDKNAREKIINANLRFVVNVAKKYQNHGIDLVDLISEGNLGLMTAIDKFDVTKGYHFISYAVWWIRQSILKAICEKSRPIRLPLNRANELVQIEKARKLVGHDKSEVEELNEIGRMLGMESEHVREMLNLSREMVSLDAQIAGDESGKTSLGVMLEDKRYSSPEDALIDESMKKDIHEVIGTLKPREQQVLTLRFGLNGDEPMSLKEVGDIVGLTKERIRQIEKKALFRLQHPVRRSKLEMYA